MGYVIIFIVVIFVLILLAINYENNKGDEIVGRFFDQSIKRRYIEKIDYSKLKKELIELRSKNKAWEREWKAYNKITSVAQELEKRGNYAKAINKYKESYRFGHESKILTINNYAHCVDRLIVLFRKTKCENELALFLTEVIEQYPNEKATKDWIVRLTKITGKSNNKNAEISKDNVSVDLAKIGTLGTKIEEIKKSLPEFDFYYKKPEEQSTMAYLSLSGILPPQSTLRYRSAIQEIDTILKKGRVLENTGNYDDAIQLYLRILSHRIINKTPYNRLMVVYKKLKQPKKEIEIVEKAIDFFENLLSEQKENVMSLAKKYGKESFALDYINNNKRIQYYGGLFDLYSPNADIDKWKQRLVKLKNKTK